MFLSFDPITAMHLGLSSDPNDIYRAEMMSHYILNKIPNTILTRPDPDAEPAVFTEFPHTAEELQAQQPHETGSGIVSALIKKSDHASKVVSQHHKTLSSGAVLPFDAEDGQLVDLENQPAFTPSSREVLPPAKIAVASQRGSRFTSYSAPVVSASPSVASSFDGGTYATPIQLALKKAVCNSIRADLPSLESIFRGTGSKGEESYLLRESDMTHKDSLGALDKLVEAGCESAQEVVSLLNETKAPSQCSCKASPHSEQCGSRKTALWMPTLVALDIPAFHALKIVKYFKPYLK
jgi:hypothetical protein